MDKYLYYVDDKPYLNITNKCSNHCDFCIRNDRKTMDGQNLWLKNQTPTAEEIIEQVKTEKNLSQEFVFCGFGEPTENLSALLSVARFIKANGGTIRLNTNGQSDLINRRSTAKEISEVCDVISISLNDCTPADYQKLCHCEFGEDAFPALLRFAKECDENGAKVILSVVNVIGEEKVEKCREICNRLGLTLRVRTYIPVTQH